MSMKQEINVKCPKCGCNIKATMWQSVNVTLDRAFKQGILDGTFNEVVCTSCGNHAHVEYPFLYHDMEKQRMVHVLASQGEDDPEKIAELESLPEQMKSLTHHDILEDASYEFRIVSNLNGLKEKIIIWDAGLDDGIVEVVKGLTLMAAYGQIDLENVKDVFFYADHKVGPEFQIYFKNGELGRTPFPQETYDMMQKDYAEIIDRHKTHRPQKIDLEWGFQVVDDILDSRRE